MAKLAGDDTCVGAVRPEGGECGFGLGVRRPVRSGVPGSATQMLGFVGDSVRVLGL